MSTKCTMSKNKDSKRPTTAKTSFIFTYKCTILWMNVHGTAKKTKQKRRVSTQRTLLEATICADPALGALSEPRFDSFSSNLWPSNCNTPSRAYPRGKLSQSVHFLARSRTKQSIPKQISNTSTPCKLFMARKAVCLSLNSTNPNPIDKVSFSFTEIPHSNQHIQKQTHTHIFI